MGPPRQPDALKVLIYATSAGKLLVFDEPDFPYVFLQVPGGTVEAGEDVAQAAMREFTEETGLSVAAPLAPLAIHDYHFELDGRDVWHRRHYFHVILSEDLPDTWQHYETTPFSGGDKILFRFFWMDMAEAGKTLGYGMAEQLYHLG